MRSTRSARVPANEWSTVPCGLLNQVPMQLALAHQAGAIAVLTLAVFQVERLAGRQPQQAPPEMVRPINQTS
jgi:cytochrome c oxidase assembly protein subunit 15